MDDFLHVYFSSSWVRHGAIAILAIWTIYLCAFAIYKKVKGLPSSRNRKRRQWAITLIFASHLILISEINPSYWGYGTPIKISQLEVQGNNLLLYDYYYTLRVGDEGFPSIKVPNLRVRVVNRLTHKKVHWQYIGEFYNAEPYGDRILMRRWNGSSNAPESVLSLSVYDASNNKEDGLLYQHEDFMIDDNSLDAKNVRTEDGWYIVTSNNNERLWLNPDNLKMEPYHPDSLPPNYLPCFSFPSLDNKRNNLFFHSEETPLVCDSCEIINFYVYNEEEEFALIYQHNISEHKNPSLSIVSHLGKELWKVSLRELKEYSDDNSLDDFHQSLFYDSFVYITANEHLFEFDLLSGQLNWQLTL
jgi:hypothetical protein